MANELTLNVGITYSKSNDAESVSVSKSITVTGAPRAAGVKSIPVSGEALDIQEIGTVGVVFVRNLDATNFVTIGLDSGTQTVKLKAGEAYAWRVNHNTIVAMANTAAVNILYKIWSD